ncbi:hypothetical protein E2542_SST02970 [Spatholobus suberectus]|nr:hypothetical protein E2542_SST02970 [Spatholobus suberectus]
MGCCVSKCRPEYKPSPEEDDHFKFNHELPISQAPPLPTLYSSTKISPSPPSPTSSTSSISSFTCTTSNTISSASSLSTASSSSLSSKDRSFSNEFLWSCYKDNPHITRINSLRDALMPPTQPQPQPRKINVNPSPPKPNLITLKRVRSNSPTNLTRQKSFRKDAERSVTINYASNMQSRSPSPSRRLNGDKRGSASLATTVTDSKRMTNSSKVSVSAVHSHNSVPSSTRKESVKAASPNNGSRRVLHSGLRHTETCTFGVGPKIDETVVKDTLSVHDMDLTLMEDIDNPLIALDCFIFL